MSLTDFVNDSDTKEQLKKKFTNKGSHVNDKDLKCEPKTKHYSLVGTTFDYLARFVIEQNSNKVSKQTWTAKNGLKTIEKLAPNYTDVAQEKYDRAEKEYNKYLKTGEITDELIEGCLDLARIEVVFRSGRTNSLQYLGDYNSGNVDDCKNLVNLLNNQENIIESDSAKLNPNFGWMSYGIGGADADLILDNNLIDIKTTKQSRFKRKYWDQLVGYCILVDCHNTLCDELDDTYGFERHPDIETMSVYFSRHGKLQEVDSNTVYDIDDYKQFRAWFVDKALNKYDKINQIKPAIPREELIRTVLCEPYEYQN